MVCMKQKRYAVGIDIGGTKCAVILGDRMGTREDKDSFILEKRVFPTADYAGWEKTVEHMAKLLEELLDKYGLKASELSGIGISCGGPLSSKKRMIMSPPNLPGWDQVPIGQILEERFHVPVILENDANACAVAEWKYGAGKGCQNMIFLTFGTGLGAGLILDGKLYSGTNDMAGEVGHVRLENYGPIGYGKAGAFEGFCSGGGISQLARMKISEQLQMGIIPELVKKVKHPEELDAKTVAVAAEEGDALAKEIYAISGRQLGRGLSILIDILNPEVIVIGSIFERCHSLLWPYAKEVMEQESLKLSLNVCKVVTAQLGDSIGDYAALSLADFETE